MATSVKDKNSGKNSLRSVFQYQWIIKNMTFFLFLSVLAVIYIANGHMADKIIRNKSKTEQEIKDLEFEYKTLKSEVMFSSEEAQILKSADPLGLKISREMPRRLQEVK